MSVPVRVPSVVKQAVDGSPPGSGVETLRHGRPVGLEPRPPVIEEAHVTPRPPGGEGVPGVHGARINEGVALPDVE